MIPMRLGENSDGSSSEGYLYTNIIFYNKFSDKSHLLLDKKSLITKFDFIKLPEKDVIILAIAENDNNGDGYISRYDEAVVYLYDLTGKKLQQISPHNTLLLDWKFDPKS